jgi:S-adenosylmethionine hydrolase
VKRIITLTTDFGLDDYYVGAMKGVILGINPDAQIIDITHSIPKYDVIKAAFTARNIYPYFPKGTIHVVVVDPGVGGKRKPIALHSEQGIFIGPDNGVFSFIYELSKEVRIREIANVEYMLEEMSNTFHGRDIFAPVAAQISLGLDINELGEGLESPVLLDFPEPTITEDEIIGEVIYTDSFGNLITNIKGDLIKGYSRIHIDKFIIDSVASSYQDADNAELLAIIGSSDFLEISVNRGSASELINDYRVTISK